MGHSDASADYGKPWYTYYIARAREYGILPESLTDVSLLRPATRAELAEILSRSLPEQELEAIHDVTTLPDYTEGDLYWNGVIARTGGHSHGKRRRRYLPAGQSDSPLRVGRHPQSSGPAGISHSGRSFRPEPSEPDTGMDAFALPESMPELPFPGRILPTPGYPYIQAVYAGPDARRRGRSGFSPNGTVALSQAVAVAVRIYEKYWGIPRHFGGLRQARGTPIT